MGIKDETNTTKTEDAFKTITTKAGHKIYIWHGSDKIAYWNGSTTKEIKIPKAHFISQVKGKRTVEGKPLCKT